MSGLKMQMKIFTNQSSKQTKNNQNQIAVVKSLKLGFAGGQRNYTALQVNGEKFCKSCNDKK
jgi:hypothetical protein